MAMKILLYTISRISKLESIELRYQKQCKQFGTEVVIKDIFNQEINTAQKQSSIVAQESYTKVFLPLLSKGLNIALHPKGKMLDTFDFAKLFENQSQVQFFIGGAFGFEQKFLDSAFCLSLGYLTLGHKIARIVLLEQIYRALSIINNHPYHK